MTNLEEQTKEQFNINILKTFASHMNINTDNIKTPTDIQLNSLNINGTLTLKGKKLGTIILGDENTFGINGYDSPQQYYNKLQPFAPLSLTTTVHHTTTILLKAPRKAEHFYIPNRMLLVVLPYKNLLTPSENQAAAGLVSSHTLRQKT